MNAPLRVASEGADEDLLPLELAPDALFVSAPDGRLTYVNQAACELCGCAKTDLLGRPLASVLPLPALDPAKPQASADGGAGALGAPAIGLRRSDGSSLPVEVRSRVLPAGTVHAWVRKLEPGEPSAAPGEPDALLRVLLDQLDVGVLIYRRDGRLSFNRRSEELLGMALDPAGGNQQYAERILTPDGQRLAPDQFPSSRARRGETVSAAEYLIVRPDGSRVPFLCNAGPVFDADGNVSGSVLVFQDLSERTRLEHTLGARERLLQAVFDLLPVGIWMADAAGRIVGNNPAAKRIWGGARYLDLPEYGQYQGWYLSTGQRIPPEDWSLARAVTKGETSNGELVRIQCFDGTFKTIINSGAPLRDEHGAITGAIVVNEDITQLHEAQERQRAGEDLLRTVFNLLPVGVWIADREGKITLANPAAEHIWWGSAPAEPARAAAYRAWSLETGQPLADEERALARAMRGETTQSVPIRIQCFDGSTKVVLSWAAPLRSAAGEIIGAVGVNEDVTSLQYTQEQLRSAVRERERILALVAHDLRNPLAALMAHAGVLQLVAPRLSGAEKVAEQAACILDIVKQMKGLVNDLLSVGAAGAGGHHLLSLSVVEPAKLVQRAAEAARPLIEATRLRLEIDCPQPVPAVRADADRILRVLGNLLDNALKFTEAPGRIAVAAKPASGGVLFSVANSGPAVPPSELETMFQPFWQAQSGRTGAGLGLAICRSIVEAHGGTIWAEPAQGERVRVRFLLPRT